MKQKLKSYFIYAILRTQKIYIDRVDAESKKAARKIGRAICRRIKKRHWMDKVKIMDKVYAFDGNTKILALVSNIETTQNGIYVSARYKTKNGEIGELRNLYLGFIIADQADDEFPKADELKLTLKTNG